MPRKTKIMLWEEKQAKAPRVREEAFEAIVKANPEMHRQLRDAFFDAEDEYNEINRKYRPLSQAQADASSLGSRLEECGLTAEATTVAGLAAIVEKEMQPIAQSLDVAIDACEAANVH
jgi:hypothetical protein